jgi:thymidylate synthase (FAD)
MKKVEIEVFNLSNMVINKKETERWLKFNGATNFNIPKNMSDSSILCGLAAKRCYMSFEPGLNPNVNKVRQDWTEYLNNVLSQGHGSVFEHATYTWAIENVSRVFTGEMNRHRAGTAISEGSMRYIRYDDIPYWNPLSLRTNQELEDLSVESGIPVGYNNIETDDDINKKNITSKVFDEVFTYIQEKYKYLVNDVWDMNNMTNFNLKKKITSCLRRIIPMGVATGGVWTINLRAIRHILATRSSEAAEEEIAYVWTLIGKKMLESEPSIFGDFKLVNGFWSPQYKKV